MLKVSISGVGETTLALERYSESFPKRLIRRLTHEVHDKAVKNAAKHTKTGRMENNIAQRVKHLTGYVYVEDDGMLVDWKGKPINYAVFVHFGARPHWIFAKKRVALRWQKGDVFHFAKAVRHPGYKGDPFMTNAAKDVFERLNEIAKEVHNATR